MRWTPPNSQRWLYNSEGLQLLEESETANMGDAQTLYEFLDFASTNYPADRVAVTFWNHGGGSVSGAAFDELHGLDSLDLAEMYQAFDAVWPADKDDPALELIGFDTCLMATVDVAAVFQNFAKYLVASEEVEPANGWLYSGWLGRLGRATPAMDGARLGRAICDSYYEGCEAVGTQDQTTLSLTDLTKADTAAGGLRDLRSGGAGGRGGGPRLLRGAGPRRRPERELRRQHPGAGLHQHGGPGPSGPADGVAAALRPERVPTPWRTACSIRVGGPTAAEATGLSCYYSYNGDMDDLNGYLTVGEGLAFKYLYAYELTGEVAEGGEDYLAELNIQELPERTTLPETGWDGAPIHVDR